MTAAEIVETLGAKPLAVSDFHPLSKEYVSAFATDLMSDALAMIQDSPEDTVLLTGLCNQQVLRTAQMLDIELIIIVRGKEFSEEVLRMSRNMGVNVFSTPFTMYESCGRLYQQGLKAIV